jgi:peptidylprolyl isomerase
MRQVIFIFIALCSFLWAEETNKKSGEKMTTTKSGLQYVITQKGSGENPQKGDNVTVHYTGKLTNGEKFDSSLERNEPFTFTLGLGEVIQGWDEGIALLNKGAKATLRIPPELAYGSQAMGPILANSTLIFEVELLDFQKAPKIEQYDIKGKKINKTDSGLQYIIVHKGKGVKATAGKQVSVHYTGFLEDGTMFDSSVARNSPFIFALGAGRVIKGWDEGVQLMSTGDKFRFIIPANLGYGSRAMGPIPANSTLVFDVELLDIK